MLFRDETIAADFLKNINYYRLKGYWWDIKTLWKSYKKRQPEVRKYSSKTIDIVILIRMQMHGKY